MIGQLDSRERSVTVVGAGVAGLLAGYYLLQHGYRVKVIDAAPNPGGLIGSAATANGLVEWAAHSFRSCPELDDLCAALDLPVVTARSKKKFILRGGRMRAMPLGVGELLGVAGRLLTRPGLGGDPSMGDWGRHHLGPVATDVLLTPVVRGIYGANPEDVSQRLVFPVLTVPKGRSLLAHFIGREKAHEKPVMSAPARGMGALVDALADAISTHPGGTLELNAPIKRLPDDANVVLATPAGAASKLLADAAPVTASALAGVRYAPLMAVTVFVKSHEPIEGIGVLAARGEQLSALGVLFNSGAFEFRAEPGLQSLTFMFGGTAKPAQVDLSPDEMRALIKADIDLLFRQGVQVAAIEIPERWRSLPVYDAALGAALEAAAGDWCAAPGRILFGNYTGQISLRGLCQSAASLGATP